jgi:outer membrane receptor protein involved in Fe transport
MKSRASAVLLLGLAGAPWPAMASAVDVDKHDEAASGGKALGEVRVTARKRSESLQQVPLSVTSLDAGELEARRIDRLDDLAAAVPGLQQGDLAITSRLTLRGVNSGDNNAFDQAVGVFVDGVYRGRMNQQHLGLFDMERIEVLKGPQVALYGNSSIGGAISAVTRKPRFVPGADARVGYETQYRATRFEGGADLPLGDDLALRFAGTWLAQDRGLSPNDANGKSEPRQENHAFRLGGLWNASDALSVGFRHEQGRHERQGHIFDVFKHVDGLGNPWPGSPFHGLDDGRLDIGNGDPFKYREAFLEAALDETLLELQYDAAAFTLTSISGFSRYDYRHSADVDLTPATLINVYQDEEYRQFSQEIRFAGDLSPRLSWLAGGYYQSDDFRNDYLSDFNLPALVAPAFGIETALASRLLSPFSRHILLDQEGEQGALFGHLDWALGEDLTAGVGMRYQRIRKNARQAVRGAGIDHVDGAGALVDVRWLDPQLAAALLSNPQYLADPTHYVLVLPDGTRLDPVLAPNNLLGYQIVSAGVGVPHEFGGLERRETHPMLEASLAWQYRPDTMYFARWSNGAKAGGFDFLYEGGDPREAEYGDESASVFEIGMKRDWPRLRLNVAAFYGRYDDLQVSVFDGGIGFTVGNAASSTSKGVEGELTWQLSPQWRAQAQVAYVDFRYRDFRDANCSTTERLNGSGPRCDWSGRRTPFVPELEAVLGISHQRMLGAWSLAQDLQWSYKGDHATASDLEPQTRQGAYSLLDYRLSLQPAAASWTLAAYGRNLADKHYNVFTSVIPLAPGGAFAHVRGRGRELGLELHYRF